jgi:hypothetical protein
LKGSGAEQLFEIMAYWAQRADQGERSIGERTRDCGIVRLGRDSNPRGLNGTIVRAIGVDGKKEVWEKGDFAVNPRFLRRLLLADFDFDRGDVSCLALFT